MPFLLLLPPPSTPATSAVADKMAKCDETAATDEVIRHGCDVTAAPALGPAQCKKSLASDLKIPECYYQPPRHPTNVHRDGSSRKWKVAKVDLALTSRCEKLLLAELEAVTQVGAAPVF